MACSVIFCCGLSDRASDVGGAERLRLISSGHGLVLISKTTGAFAMQQEKRGRISLSL